MDETYTGELKMHHAYLLATNGAASEAVRAFVAERFDVSTTGNADFFHIRADTLGVDEARRVSELAQRAALAGEGTFFLIEATFLTREAQNALLKTLEEPTAGATFVVAVPSHEHLLATIRSRLAVLPFTPPRGPAGGGREFFEAGMTERVKKIAELADEKDRAGALRILTELEQILYGEFRSGNTAALAALRVITRVRTYVGDTGSSVKMLLESVAVALKRR